MLAMLAVAPGGRRERRWLQYKLWSERGEREGAASLRQTLSALRRALAPMGDVLEADRTTVTLSLSEVAVDALELPSVAQRLPGQAEYIRYGTRPDRRYEEPQRSQ